MERPARGLVICPCCNNLGVARPWCLICGGLGYTSLVRRNLYKLGLRF
jgi:hypothetical protein